MADKATTSTRKPYTGSCHCGAFKYIVFLSLPHQPHEKGQDRSLFQRLYRCNCTICHKRGHFHVRVASDPDDFLVLSPADPLRELGDYTCGKGLIHWLFCKGCGVTCFGLGAASEVVDVDLVALGVPPTQVEGEEGDQQLGKKTRVWRVSAGGQVVKKPYLTVNGHTVDAGQGFDMVGVVDEGKVEYHDWLSDEGIAGPPRLGKPFADGCY